VALVQLAAAEVLAVEEARVSADLDAVLPAGFRPLADAGRRPERAFELAIGEVSR